MKKALKIAGEILVLLVLLTPLVCWALGIRFFKLGVTPVNSSARVDRIDGFYVTVFTENVYTTTDEEGNTYAHFGSDKGVTDYNWKHKEMSSIVPFKRFLFFAKETEAEAYNLLSEDGEFCYGSVQVLRAPNGKLHYYYKRMPIGVGIRFSPEVLHAETLSFSYDGGDLPLTDYIRFSSRVDFTTGDKILSVNGYPCRLSPR
ncbi:MAG: hypothetical protein IKP55_00030 [Clostridia bacterium]|nr:hypothetical protein [Clostridia bacterium]